MNLLLMKVSAIAVGSDFEPTIVADLSFGFGALTAICVGTLCWGIALVARDCDAISGVYGGSRRNSETDDLSVVNPAATLLRWALPWDSRKAC
jgi:hypothetical protein